MENLTHEQQDILFTFLGSDDNISVLSGPGSGKTFITQQILKLTEEYQKVLYLVFNKKNQLEAVQKMPAHVKTRTFHAFCLEMAKYNLGEIVINKSKQFDILMERFKEEMMTQDSKQVWAKLFKYDRIISIIRTSCPDLSLTKVESQIFKHSIAESLEEGELQECIGLVRKCRNFKKGGFDFANMIEYVALTEKVKVPHFDLIAFDEVQDASALNFLVLRKLQPDRMLIVGDEKQAINGFAGADHTIFHQIIDEWNMVQKEITISFRCSREAVRLSNEVFPGTVNCMEGAKEGQVFQDGVLEDADENSFVLSRTNAALVEAYFYLLEQGIPATIQDKEIERGLKRFIRSFGVTDTDDLLECLEDLIDRLPGMEKTKSQRIETEEKVQAVKILAKGTKTVPEIIFRLDDMFEEKEKAVRLMTIHKSKGLEAEKVFIITHFNGREILPHPSANTVSECYAEQCLRFVAVSRSKNEVHFVKL